MRERPHWAHCMVTFGSLFGKRGVLMVYSPYSEITYLLGLLRSGGSIAKQRLLDPSRAWTKPCLRTISQTLHRWTAARGRIVCLFEHFLSAGTVGSRWCVCRRHLSTVHWGVPCSCITTAARIGHARIRQCRGRCSCVFWVKSEWFSDD